MVEGDLQLTTLKEFNACSNGTKSKKKGLVDRHDQPQTLWNRQRETLVRNYITANKINTRLYSQRLHLYGQSISRVDMQFTRGQLLVRMLAVSPSPHINLLLPVRPCYQLVRGAARAERQPPTPCHHALAAQPISWAPSYDRSLPHIAGLAGQ